MKIRYIHTLNGRPAFFVGTHLAFAYPRMAIPSARTLRQIKEEQRIDKINFEKSEAGVSKIVYGYARIEIG